MNDYSRGRASRAGYYDPHYQVSDLYNGSGSCIRDPALQNSLAILSPDVGQVGAKTDTI
jgi:hypothetical protein